jgi:hypothetical protein
MVTFIKKTIRFTFFTVVFYVVLLFVWGKYAPSIFKTNLNYKIGGPGHTFSRLKEIKKIKDIDILFLGSSHAYRGFDTRIFKAKGISSFNLGSSAQTPIETKLLLRRYLNQINPKMIVYEVDPLEFSSDGVESSLDIIANDINDNYSLKMAFELNNIKVYNTLIFSFINQFFDLNTSFLEKKVKGEDTYMSGGYVEKKIRFYKTDYFKEQKWDFNEKQFNSFNEIIHIMKEKQIEFVLVNAPMTAALYNSYKNNNVFDYYMRKYPNYYNFNQILQLNDSLHFYDSNHLNQNGVRLFNQKLIEILKHRSSN